MAELTDTQQMSDAEGAAWDALHDDPNIVCTCDGCNFYSPTHDPDRECSLAAHIQAISRVVVREHVTAALDEIDRRLATHAGVDASCRRVVRDYRQEQDR